MSAYVRASSLAVLLAGPAAVSAAAHRRLHQASAGSLCSWDATECSLNGDAVATLNPLADLAGSEADLKACFDPMNAFAPCSSESALAPGQVAAGPAAAVAPAEAPAAAADVDPASIKLTPLALEADQGAVAPAAGGVQAWDPKNPPDYSVPAQCPFDGHINPLTSGMLPDEFVHKTDDSFQPFEPDQTPIELDTICAKDAPATEHGHGKVLMKDPDTGLCQTCPDAKCTIWIPDLNGWYMPHCTGAPVLDEAAEFDVKFPIPGDEEEAGWGPDANPHVHFQCEGCGGIMFNKYYPLPENDYCQTSTAGNMLMSAPDDSNMMQSVKIGAGQPGTFYIIMQDDWQMMSPNGAGAKCWAQKFANPCPQYATVGEACDDVPDPKPEPDIAGLGPAAAPVEPVEVCVLGGAQLDYPGADYPDADSLTTADAAECAEMCAAADGCEASIFVDRAAGQGGELPNCYFKEGLVAGGATAVPDASTLPAPRSITLMQPCADVQWADGTQTARRRLAQAQADAQCKELPVAGGQTVCVPAEAEGGPQQLQAALTIIDDQNAFAAECPMNNLKDGSATMPCKQKWMAYFAMVGCMECAADVDAVQAAAKACGAATSEEQCAKASKRAAQAATAAGSDLAWPSVATAPQPPSTQNGTGTEAATQQTGTTGTTDGAVGLAALPLVGAILVLCAALF